MTSLEHRARLREYEGFAYTLVTPRQPTRLTTTNAIETNKQEYGVNLFREQVATDQLDPWQIVPRHDPWQVVPRQVFTGID